MKTIISMVIGVAVGILMIHVLEGQVNEFLQGFIAGFVQATVQHMIYYNFKEA